MNSILPMLTIPQQHTGTPTHHRWTQKQIGCRKRFPGNYRNCACVHKDLVVQRHNCWTYRRFLQCKCGRGRRAPPLLIPLPWGLERTGWCPSSSADWNACKRGTWKCITTLPRPRLVPPTFLLMVQKKDLCSQNDRRKIRASNNTKSSVSQHWQTTRL